MATIQKRGNSYRIRAFCGYTASGRQIEKTKTWKPDLGMTERQIEKELDRQKVLFEESCRGASVQDANIKFERFAVQWFDEYAKPNLRTRTVDRYKQYTGRAYAAIGGLRLDKISSRHIQAFIKNLQEPDIKTGGGALAPKTVRGYLSFISTIFDYAVKQDMIKDNPCRRVILPPLKQKPRDCYSLEEAQRFLELLEKEPMPFRVFFTLAIYGGFRKGELLGLEWKDIDFDSCVITIRRTSLYSNTKHGTFTDTTKTKQSQRSLKLPAAVFDLLREYRIKQNEERLRLADKWQDMDRLFTAWNGAPMGTSTPLKWLDAFFERTGMRRVTIHSFRHLNASLLINAGVDIKTVSASLGHSETSTTLNIYAHTFAQAQARAADAIGDALALKKDIKKAGT
ncbi:Tyrosine recombinase XerC [Caprobacter fermentans]|uniref:Tyrosine recombinase XerC n=1 Tax=Caproicibacter fermentans TaxID=2576756 RepID=A0A6N8HZT1_9FIRM|nr:site-specific integrase [Caproicibacter fermentans]MVB11336.1 Tyrosine recombinase XerC [Caproicibacter fermentans]